MKMPNKIDKNTVAICGMNCIVCYKHLKKDYKKCNGCKNNDETLHCRKCQIKACAKDKGFEYCFECDDFPCKWIKSLDKSYKLRYKTSLIENGLYIKENGIQIFLEREKDKWTCLDCKGIISLHNKFCSECSKLID